MVLAPSMCPSSNSHNTEARYCCLPCGPSVRGRTPGDAISGPPPSDEELNRLRQATLSNLRLEVARLRPTPTSAHCRPRVHVPNNLRTTSHVMIRRGGVQPSFTTSYLVKKTPSKLLCQMGLPILSPFLD